jgi:hypothetical protein
MTTYRYYTYYIAWTSFDKHYYGVRHSKNCHPDELWQTYFSSSKHVKEFRDVHGEPDIVEVRKTFNDPSAARLWEANVLTRLKAAQSDCWLNKHNGNGAFYCAAHSDQTREKMRKRDKTTFAMYGKFGAEHQRYGKKHTDEWKANQKVRSKNVAAGRRWYTNGDTNKWLRPDLDVIPGTFKPGRTLKKVVR